MAQLPNEIYRQILSPLDLGTLQACRLAGRPILQAATELVFRRVTLRVEFMPAQLARSGPNFVQIATAAHLRPLVREVAIDTAVTPAAFLHADTVCAAANVPVPRLPEAFLYALPFLNTLTGLKSLEVAFAGGNGTNSGDWLFRHQRGPFAGLVLDTCLRCIAGDWSFSRHVRLQTEILHAMQGEGGTLSTEWPSLVTAPQKDPMEVTTLEVTDMPVSLQLAVPDMLLSCESLKHLHLNLSFSELDSVFHNLPRQRGDRFDYFETLPKTWLTPDIANNLRVLSLSHEEYWGWAPKMDLRTVNPGVGFPNLRVLSLGCYVFSHEWQVDWIVTLGHQNGRGGLEELYLKDCPIMWEASVHSSLDESVTELATLSGGVVSIPNEGYPTDQSLQLPDELSDLIEVSFPLRWSSVLDRWANTMASSLKIFAMGSEPWGEGLYEQWRELPANTPGLIQYVHFNIGLDPQPWIETDDRRRMINEIDGLDKYHAARKADYDSYDNFINTVFPDLSTDRYTRDVFS
ncbi:hypothetical protein PG985_010311 [Apiospora marii]|uniref:uncharacterized protein n=1 Tax=Apiospora marii TaxID=335849 RepID=UPI00312D7D43